MNDIQNHEDGIDVELEDMASGLINMKNQLDELTSKQDMKGIDDLESVVSSTKA